MEVGPNLRNEVGDVPNVNVERLLRADTDVGT